MAWFDSVKSANGKKAIDGLIEVSKGKKSRDEWEKDNANNKGKDGKFTWFK